MPLLFSLIFNDSSAWWLLPCLFSGFGLAWLFYQKSSLENSLLKWLLFALRGILLSLLAFLLLAPLLQSIKKRLEKPLIILAQDASQSVSASVPEDFDSVSYHQDLKKLANDLSKDYEVKTIHFGDGVEPGFNFKQDAKQTDYSKLFDYVQDQFTNRNIGAMIFASDGIFNRGANPVNRIANSEFPVYTIALGDTIPKKDVVLLQVNYNDLVYLGDDHQLEIHLAAFKMKGVKTVLTVSTNDGQKKLMPVDINDDAWRKTFNVTLEARKKGVQKITVEVQPVKDELSVQNNRQTVFVEVLDGREQILILADAPHPDISAIRQAIEGNKNYEVKVAYAEDVPANVGNYGLMIFHGLPSARHPVKNILAQAAQKSKWFIITTTVNTSALSQIQHLLNVSTNNATQEYSPSLNKDFYAFSLNDKTKEALAALAPLVAPFGNYSLKNAGVTLFQQKVGNVVTNAPLLAFGDDGGVKTAILTGEGIWRWRLEDFEQHQNHEAVDELITKTVQYLNARDDKRKFRVRPIKNKFAENEQVILNAELYNDAFQLNNEPDVSVDISSKEGKKYSFLFSRDGQSYQLDAGFLPSGEYTFAAKTTFANKPYTANGQFVIEELNAELMQTTANHQLLYSMATQSGGKMVYPSGIHTLKDLISKNEKVKTISYEEKSYEHMIDLKWFFMVIMLLLGSEWFLRKRNGAI